MTNIGPSGNAPASTGTTAVTEADGANVILGATANTTASSTIYGKFLKLISVIPAALGQGTSAQSLTVVGASDWVDTVKAQSGVLTNRSGTIATGGTAQNAAGALAGRVYLFLLNPATETEILWFSTITTAVAASPSIPLYPGQSFEFNGTFCPTGAVSVIAATTGHVFIGREA